MPLCRGGTAERKNPDLFTARLETRIAMTADDRLTYGPEEAQRALDRLMTNRLEDEDDRIDFRQDHALLAAYIRELEEYKAHAEEHATYPYRCPTCLLLDKERLVKR